MSIQNLKEQYGNAIKYSTIELLMKVRNDSLGKEERNDLFKNCEEIYNITKKSSAKEKNFNVFKHVIQNYEDVEKTASTNLNGSFSEEDNGSDGGRPRFGSESSLNSARNTTRAIISTNIEGFLEVDKGEIAGTTNTISTK